MGSPVRAMNRDEGQSLFHGVCFLGNFLLAKCFLFLFCGEDSLQDMGCSLCFQIAGAKGRPHRPPLCQWEFILRCSVYLWKQLSLLSLDVLHACMLMYTMFWRLDVAIYSLSVYFTQFHLMCMYKCISVWKELLQYLCVPMISTYGYKLFGDLAICHILFS